MMDNPRVIVLVVGNTHLLLEDAALNHQPGGTIAILTMKSDRENPPHDDLAVVSQIQTSTIKPNTLHLS